MVETSYCGSYVEQYHSDTGCSRYEESANIDALFTDWFNALVDNG
jgi:hypothetical protein